ncbi:AEC family transporter [Ahrensia sp. 13_GOM-1096m]|uniref:AEC family transporter n=1 Tax=Ahrensia sp. 13_GOM-1096m TaxID=1380380 RepID=UPI00047A4B4C|nr:AEC family transporter [Ahrensia sp. 13_GOM-1096m]
MASIIALVLPFFGLIALGFATARLTKQPLEALGWMNTFIIYIALPALFFKLLSQTPIEELTQWRYILATTFSTYIAFSLVFALGIWRSKGNVAESAIMGFAGAYGNIGYMAPGLALLAFGEAAVVPVALIFCFDNTLHFVLAPLLMALSGSGDQNISKLQLVGQVAKRILLHPFILATIVGVLAAIFEVQPPIAIGTLIDYLANAAAPCALFAMGVSLALRPLKRVPQEAIFIAPMKLIIQPIIVYILVTSIGDFPPIWVYCAMLLAALPSATNVFVIAQQYNIWVERASAMVLITTVLSVFTVTALLYLAKNNLIPL